MIEKFDGAQSAYLISLGTCLGLLLVFCGFLCCVPKVCMLMSVLISCIAVALPPVALSFIDQAAIDSLVAELPAGWVDPKGLYSFLQFGVVVLYGLLGFWVLVCIICSVKLEIAASIMQTTAKVILRNVWIFLIPLVGYALIGAYLGL